MGSTLGRTDAPIVVAAAVWIGNIATFGDAVGRSSVPSIAKDY